MVHAGAGSAGLEWRASPKQAFCHLLWRRYFGRNFFPTLPNTAHPRKPPLGTVDRALQIPTTAPFSRSRSIGCKLSGSTAGTSSADLRPVFLPDSRSMVCGIRARPKNAHLSMVYAVFATFSLRPQGPLNACPTQIRTNDRRISMNTHLSSSRLGAFSRPGLLLAGVLMASALLLASLRISSFRTTPHFRIRLGRHADSTDSKSGRSVQRNRR